MKKFGDGQQPFHAIIDIPEGDSQELTTVTDQALNSLYGELFNLLQTHGINPTTTTNADLKQVARAVWSAVSAGNLYKDTGGSNVKNLTHTKAGNFLFKNTNANDDGFIIEFLNKTENTGAVTINVFDAENNENHFNNIPLVYANGNELSSGAMTSGAMVRAYYSKEINKFVILSAGNLLDLSSDLNGQGDELITVKQPVLNAVKRTQHSKNFDFVTPLDFGAVGNGIADDSIAISNAIFFAYTYNRQLDGLGLTYACNNVMFDSNLQFSNANLVCNKYDADMISVLNSGESDEWLENVELVNVKINGKRELHTNIKAQTTSEDGGRHGFRIVRKTRNLKMTNCEAVNCATEGIILYPKSGAGNNRIVDVVLTDCNFSGNRRHGGSSDSVNGITFTRVKCNRNGLDIDVNAASNSGLRGDRFNANLFGNGWDFEEYAQDVVSTNIVLNDCEMVQNARMGILVYTHGNTSESAPKAIIKINGGSYDKGQFADTNIAIICRPSAAYTGQIKNTALFSVTGANLNGGGILCGYANNFTTRSLVNFGTISVVQNTVAYTDVPKSSVYMDPNSVINFDFKNQNGELNYSNGVMVITPKTNSFYYRHDIAPNGVIDFGLSHGGHNGGIRIKFDSDNSNAAVAFTDFNRAEYITFSRTKITPLRGNYTLGDATYRFETIYLNTAANVASDERIKKDIRLLTDAEKLVAKDLKSEICIYRLKDNDEKLQIGVIAQKVVSSFEKHGLNALDYQVVHYDADIDRYSIVYEQLMLFIIAAM